MKVLVLNGNFFVIQNIVLAIKCGALYLPLRQARERFILLCSFFIGKDSPALLRPFQELNRYSIREKYAPAGKIKDLAETQKSINTDDL